MLIQRLARPIASRAFLLILCACAGQALIPAKGPSPAAQDSLARLSDGAAATVTVPGHPSFTEYLGVNDRGEIAIDAGNGKPTVAYIARAPYRSSDFRKVEVPGAKYTTVTALNEGGTSVGYYTDSNGHIAAFSERAGVWARYSKGSDRTEYLGINDIGTVVGFFTDARGVDHAFSRDLKSGKDTQIGPDSNAIASAVNNNGAIVGYIEKPDGSAKAFLWAGGVLTKFSYPGAVRTEALGIAEGGQIVGSYTSTSGKVHSFTLSDLTTSPRWKRFDDPQAHGVTVLNSINSRGDIAGYYRDAHSRTRGFFCCTDDSAATPPPVLPVWGLGGDQQDTDPGATPDQHLFGVIEDSGYTSNSQLAKNCPGVSSTSTCQPYKYVDLFYDSCNTPVTLAAYKWADSNDETAFQHVYPNGTTASNRIEWMATPNPSGPDCKPDNANSVMRMNPGDPAFNKYLSQNVWQGSNQTYDFGPPYGVFEDQASVFAGIVVGGFGQVSTEYASGNKPSGFANAVGNSPYHATTDWETAIGTFVNGACGTHCLNVGLNSVATGSGNVGTCSIVSNGHCHAEYQSGEIDNQADFDNICSTVQGGNMRYFMAERPLYTDRAGLQFLNSHSMTVQLNTIADLYSHTADGCANSEIVLEEPSYGPGGLGDITGGYQIRLATLALRWLVANPATGIPDRVLSFLLSEGQTTGEAPYFFEDTLVPAGAEVTVPKYVFNGVTVTAGGGCPSTSGDSGGAVSLLVECVGSSGIYCQQYQHLYINQVDYGKAATCLNTSTTNENITSSWFKNDPISSYSYVLSPKGGEMTTVPYQGVTGGSIALKTCTNKTYCTGQSTLSTQVSPFKGDGSDVLCAQCGDVLLESD